MRQQFEKRPVFKIFWLWFQLTVDLIKSAIPVFFSFFFSPTNSRMTSRSCSTATKRTCFCLDWEKCHSTLFLVKEIQDCKSSFLLHSKDYHHCTSLEAFADQSICRKMKNISLILIRPDSWKQRKSDKSDMNKASVFVDVLTLNCLKSPGDTDMASPAGAVFQTPLFLILRKVSLCKLTKKDRQTDNGPDGWADG